MRARLLLPVLSFVTCLAQAPPARRFEVAAIKQCKTGNAPGERGGASLTPDSPGRLSLNCITVKGLIQMAYLFFEGGAVHPAVTTPIFGGPSWIDSETYSIVATTSAPQSQMTMRGPMMQALLEDRFHLKLHRETREIPVYALTVAKGGPKLQPFPEGSCTPIDFAAFPPPAPLPGQTNCLSRTSLTGPNLLVEVQATTLDDFCKFFLGRLDRPVVNRTGIAGKFNIRLQYADRATLPDDTTAAPRIFTALQEQLGLKLEPATGPGAFLMIDSVERPTEN